MNYSLYTKYIIITAADMSIRFQVSSKFPFFHILKDTKYVTAKYW